MDRRHRSLVATALVAMTMTAGFAPHAFAGTAPTAPAGTKAPRAAVSATTATATSDATTAAGYLKQWMFDPNNPHHPLLAKSGFNGPASRNTNLKNSMEHRFLQWEHQTFGINLGWTDDASAATAVRVSRWFFTRADTTRPIRYGDTVALGNGQSPSYIRYANRTVGINLEWSSTPRYEWQLLGGPIGQPVRSGDWLAIYNTTTKQPLIYFDRTVGADIGWPNSETWGQQLSDAVMAFIKDHWKEGVAFLLTHA
jgi:hypothetical protein